MVKILSQGGRSLADMYDVEGSIAGIDSIETRELPLVHEMGATLFSERFRTTFRRVTTGALNQNATSNLAITNMPEGISRILGVQVWADAAARIASCAVAVNDPIAGGGQDFPIWVFDIGNSTLINVEDLGAVAARDLLTPVIGLQIPTFLTTGTQGPLPMSEIDVRTTTTGFGAGTVTLFALIHFAFTYTGGVSAFGARVPSW